MLLLTPQHDLAEARSIHVENGARWCAGWDLIRLVWQEIGDMMGRLRGGRERIGNEHDGLGGNRYTARENATGRHDDIFLRTDR